jgi:hypothetical protein
MDRKAEAGVSKDHWWDHITPEHKRALNILFSQEPARLRINGFRLTTEELATITMQLASYKPGRTLLLGQKTFNDPVALAKHIIKVHPGLAPGRTFSEF